MARANRFTKNITWSDYLGNIIASVSPYSLLLHSLSLINTTTHTHSTSTMLASSRTVLRQAASKQFTVKAGARSVSAWSQVPQGPPVSQAPCSDGH